MSQRDREGRLAFINRLPHNQRTYPSDCKAGASKKPSPLGEGGRREPDGRGELSLNSRLPPNQRTYPSDCRSKKQHQIRKAIQHRKRAPPHRALTGPPPTQRGRLNYSPQSRSKTKIRPPLGEGGPRQRWKGGTRSQS